MSTVPQVLSNTFQELVNSAKTGGIILVLCAAISIAIANFAIGSDYISFSHTGFLWLLF